MEESSSINSIRDNAKNVKGNGQNSDKRFSLMNNGIIAIELNTVKDINSKNTKYNLVVSAFSVKDNYMRNTLQKRADSVEYTKKDLSQLKPQLYEWLASVNERSNGFSQVNHQLHESLAIINEKSDGFGKQLRNNSTTASSEVLNEGISRSNSPKREGVEPISSNGNTSTARTAGTATGSNSASDGDVSTNSIRDNTENVKRNGQKSDTPDIRRKVLYLYRKFLMGFSVQVFLFCGGITREAKEMTGNERKGKTRYFVVEDFGTIVVCERRSEIPVKLGYKNRAEMIQDNGWVYPDIYEISESEYKYQEQLGYYDEV